LLIISCQELNACQNSQDISLKLHVLRNWSIS